MNHVSQGPKVALSDAELAECSPCQLIRNALPTRLANSLLESVLEDTPNLVRGSWWMFGKVSYVSIDDRPLQYLVLYFGSECFLVNVDVYLICLKHPCLSNCGTTLV